MDEPARDRRPTIGPDIHGWIRLEPILVSRHGRGVLIDAVVIDAVVIDSEVLDGAVVEPTTADDGDRAPAHRRRGLGDGPTASRGAPVTLALSVPAGDDEGDGPVEVADGADLEELADAVGSADMLHVFRDDVGTALILRRGPAWWYLEVD